MAGALHVLAVEQRQEFRVREVVAPSEDDQALDRLHRSQGFEMQFALGSADVGVGLLEDGEEQLVLALEVVVDELLVDAGALGDRLDPGAAEAVGRELGRRRGEDFLLRAIGVARADFYDVGGAGGHAGIIHQTVN